MLELLTPTHLTRSGNTINPTRVLKLSWGSAYPELAEDSNTIDPMRVLKPKAVCGADTKREASKSAGRKRMR